MQLSKKDLISKIETKVENEDVKIELMEDVTDSIPDDIEAIIAEQQAKFESEKADLEAQIANEKAYIADLKRRYKERFLDKEVNNNDLEPSSDEGLIEEKIVDIKEI